MKIFYSALLSLILLPDLTFAADDPMASLFKFQSQMVQQGNVEAMMKLGNMYEEGQGTQQDWNKALEMYRQAENKGNPNAKAAIQRIKQKKTQQLNQAKAAKEKASQEKLAREKQARIQAEKARQEKEAAARRLLAEKEKTRQQQAAKQRKEIKKPEQKQIRKQETTDEISGYDEDS